MYVVKRDPISYTIPIYALPLSINCMVSPLDTTPAYHDCAYTFVLYVILVAVLVYA